MSAAVNRSLRTATKHIRYQPRSLRLAATPLTAAAATRSAALLRTTSSQQTSSFSTSTVRASGAPVMSSGPREYDPEIKDIADYVANYPIDSELAVSCLFSLPRLLYER